MTVLTNVLDKIFFLFFFSVSPTKPVVDAHSNVRHKNTATDEDDGIYEGVECRPNSTLSKRRKSDSPIKKVTTTTSNDGSRLTDKATQTGMDEEDEDEKKRKKSGNCVIL